MSDCTESLMQPLKTQIWERQLWWGCR